MEALRNTAYLKFAIKLHHDCPTSIIRVLCRMKNGIITHEQPIRRRSRANKHKIRVSNIKDKDLSIRVFSRTCFFEGLTFS